MEVFVRTNIGEQVSVKVDPSWKVAKIKENLAKQINTSKEDIKIIFAGKELPDDLIIYECDLGNHSILHAVRISASSHTSLKTSGAMHIKKTLNTDLREYNETDNSKPAEPVNCSGNPTGTKPLLQAPAEGCNQNLHRRLLCDSSSVLSIQLSEAEQQQLKAIKDFGTAGRPQYFVFCSHPCSSVQVGKLRVRCKQCKSGALMVHRDPSSWKDVLEANQITATCETPGCDFTIAEFFFKCREHETLGADDLAVPLYLIRVNLPQVPCLACTDIASPVIVFECSSAHTMCLDCFVTYCISRLNERQFVQNAVLGYTLPCPAGCDDSLIREVHHFKLMGNHHYERYQHFSTEEAVLAAGGVLCPQPGCGQGIIADPDCQRIVCINGCGYVFCRLCLQGFHIGDCQDLFDDMQSSDSLAFSLNPGRLSQAKYKDISKVAIKKMTKPCPKCRTATERDGGCMHMVCTRGNCGFHWCWVCQTEWTRNCMADHWFG